MPLQELQDQTPLQEAVEVCRENPSDLQNVAPAQTLEDPAPETQKLSSQTDPRQIQGLPPEQREEQDPHISHEDPVHVPLQDIV